MRESLWKYTTVLLGGSGAELLNQRASPASESSERVQRASPASESSERVQRASPASESSERVQRASPASESSERVQRASPASESSERVQRASPASESSERVQRASPASESSERVQRASPASESSERVQRASPASESSERVQRASPASESSERVQRASPASESSERDSYFRSFPGQQHKSEGFNDVREPGKDGLEPFGDVVWLYFHVSKLSDSFSSVIGSGGWKGAVVSAQRGDFGGCGHVVHVAALACFAALAFFLALGGICQRRALALEVPRCRCSLMAWSKCNALKERYISGGECLSPKVSHPWGTARTHGIS
jgi:hypothetical protein